MGWTDKKIIDLLMPVVKEEIEKGMPPLTETSRDGTPISQKWIAKDGKDIGIRWTNWGPNTMNEEVITLEVWTRFEKGKYDAATIIYTPLRNQYQFIKYHRDREYEQDAKVIDANGRVIMNEKL